MTPDERRACCGLPACIDARHGLWAVTTFDGEHVNHGTEEWAWRAASVSIYLWARPCVGPCPSAAA